MCFILPTFKPLNVFYITNIFRHHKKMSDDSDDELLLRNVNDLKKRLLQTERSLQLLQSPSAKSTASSRESGSRGKFAANASLSR